MQGGQRGSASLTLSQTAAKQGATFASIREWPLLIRFSPHIYFQPTRLVVSHDGSRAGAGSRKNTPSLEKSKRGETDATALNYE